MKIKRLFGSDLFSYRQLDMSLADLGLVIVEGSNTDLGGSNGSGKSNIFKILSWILYGKAPQNGETLTADDVIREDENHQPIIGQTRGFVQIERDGMEIQIFRHRRHADSGNKVLLYLDGKDCTMGADKETQLRIDDLLGLDYDAFIQAVMFPQEAVSFARLGDAKQKEILDRILGTERFDAARDKVKKQLAEMVTSFGKMQGQIVALRNQQTQEETALGSYRYQASNWQIEKNSAVTRASAAYIEARRLEPTPPLPEHQATVERLQDYIKQIDPRAIVKQMVEVQERRLLLLADLSAHRLAVSQKPKWDAAIPEAVPLIEAKVRDKQQSLANEEASARRLAAEVQDQQTRIRKRDSMQSCQLCGQELTPAAKDRMFGKLAEESAISATTLQKMQQYIPILKAELVVLQAELKVSQNYAEYLRRIEEHAKIAPAMERIQVEVNSIDATASQFKAAHEACEQYTNSKRICDDYRERVQIWEQSLAASQRNVEAAKNSECPYSKMAAEAERNMARRQVEMDRLDSLATKIDKKIEQLRFWEFGFGPKGVKSLLLDHVCPELNRLANEYLDILSSGMARMKFDTQKSLKSGEQRDNFHCEVEYQAGAGSYRKISGGERQRPDLAAMFALGELGAARSRSPIQLRLLDEPFDNLDALGAEQVVEVLRTKILPKAGTVLVMTHDDNLKQLIDKRIVVVKECGVSSLKTVAT